MAAEQHPDLNAVAERLDALAPLSGPLGNSLFGDDLRAAAECVRLVAAIREPSEALVRVAATAIIEHRHGKDVPIIPADYGQARAALRAMAERGAGE